MKTAAAVSTQINEEFNRLKIEIDFIVKKLYHK